MSRKNNVMHNAYIIVGMVDGCGYDDQLKCTDFDIILYSPCHSILAKHTEASFSPTCQIWCIYNLLRCLDLQIWRFLCP